MHPERSSALNSVLAQETPEAIMCNGSHLLLTPGPSPLYSEYSVSLTSDHCFSNDNLGPQGNGERQDSPALMVLLYLGLSFCICSREVAQ